MLVKNFYEIYRNISTTCSLKDVTGAIVTNKYIYFNNTSTGGSGSNVNYRSFVNSSTSSSYITDGYNQLGVLYGRVNDGNPETLTSWTRMGMGLIGVGTDDTPVTYEDYKLGSIIALPQTQYNIINIVEDGKHIGLGYTVNINNNTGADVEIKEVGLYSGCYAQVSTQRPFLIYREVLETPITIPNGQSVVATIRLM